MLGSRPAAAFLVMKHHTKEIRIMPLQEMAPSAQLTCLSFLPRQSRLPGAPCNDTLASVQSSPSVGSPAPCPTVPSALTLVTWHSWESLLTLRTHGSREPVVSLLALVTFLSLGTYQTAQHIHVNSKTTKQICCLCSLWSTSVWPHQQRCAGFGLAPAFAIRGHGHLKLEEDRAGLSDPPLALSASLAACHDISPIYSPNYPSYWNVFWSS